MAPGKARQGRAQGQCSIALTLPACRKGTATEFVQLLEMVQYSTWAGSTGTRTTGRIKEESEGS